MEHSCPYPKVYSGAYWQQFSVNEDTATPIFDLQQIEGIESPGNIRILRRTNGFGNTWIDTNAAHISLDPLILEVSGYNIMGQYCLASTGGNSFGIVPPDNVLIAYSAAEHRAQLFWDPVPDALYYNVYAADDPSSAFEEWDLLIQLPHPITAFDTSAYPQKRFFFITAEK